MTNNPLDHEHTWTYDTAGNLRYVTDANGHTFETRFDQWHRAYLTIDAEGNQSLAHLDGTGNKT